MNESPFQIVFFVRKIFKILHLVFNLKSYIKLRNLKKKYFRKTLDDSSESSKSLARSYFLIFCSTFVNKGLQLDHSIVPRSLFSQSFHPCFVSIFVLSLRRVRSLMTKPFVND